MSQWSGWQDYTFEDNTDNASYYQHLPSSNSRMNLGSQLAFEQYDPRYWTGVHQYDYRHSYDRSWQARQPSPHEHIVSSMLHWDDSSSCTSSHAHGDRSPPTVVLPAPMVWGYYGANHLESWSGGTSVNPSNISHHSDASWDDYQLVSPPDLVDLETKAERYSIGDLTIDSPHGTSQDLLDDPPTLTPHTRSSFSSSDSESEYEPPSHTRHRTHTRHRAHARSSKNQTHKVTKASQAKKGNKVAASPRHTKSISSASSDESKEEKSRHFSCPLLPYGCQATFATKNEWKRHFMSHLLLDFFRCDLCQNFIENPNDFNRKDLFLQHLRRMHKITTITAPRANTEPRKTPAKRSFSPTESSSSLSTTSASDQEICSRCHVPVHDPPTQTSCVICSETFTGPQSCREWLEHVGRHLAKMGKDNGDIVEVAWDTDKSLRDWLLAVGIIVPTDAEGVWQLADDTYNIKAEAFARKAKIADGEMRA